MRSSFQIHVLAVSAALGLALTSACHRRHWPLPPASDPARIESFTSAPQRLFPGSFATLFAQYTGGVGTVDHGLGALESGAGLQTDPLSADTTFTLEVTPAVGTAATAQTSVAMFSALTLVAGVPQNQTFLQPAYLAIDRAGNLYASLESHSIQQLIPTTANGVTTWTANVIAGQPTLGGYADGPGPDARFQNPQGLVADAAGNLYVADQLNYCIRMLTPPTGGATTWTVSTIAGSPGHMGIADGPGASATFGLLSGLAIDGSGNLLAADWNGTIRMVTPTTANGITTWSVSTFAGTGYAQGSADGPATSASFYEPGGIAVDGAGNVYVVDEGNENVRMIAPPSLANGNAWTVSTIAGPTVAFSGPSGLSGSADGPGADATFAFPQGCTLDASGNLYVADRNNDLIRRLTPTANGGTTTWMVSTLAGTAQAQGCADGAGDQATFNDPTSVLADPSGQVYVADRMNGTVRLLAPTSSQGTTTWNVSTLYGNIGPSAGSADGPGVAATFNEPEGVAVDAAGNVYVADSFNSTIRQLTPVTGNGAPAWTVGTLAGTAGSAGMQDGPAASASFAGPLGLATNAAGNVYVADSYNNAIRLLAPPSASGATAWTVTTIAGGHGFPGKADGPGASATFYQPSGLAVDGDGNIYVADSGNASIRRITPSTANGTPTWTVSTIAGTGVPGWQDGPGASATFYLPGSVAVDASGNLYVADTFANTIRMLTPATLNGTTTWTVSTIAGTAMHFGAQDGPGATATFNRPSGLAVDASGDVYVADTWNGTIRLVRPTTANGTVTWTVSTVVGIPGGLWAVPGPLPATLYRPVALALDPTTGGLLVTAPNAVLEVW